MSILDVVFLLLVANSAPILADCLLRKKLSIALDAGLLFTDGQPIFGASKTVRGIAASIVVTTGAALVIGQSAAIGLLVGAVAMIGDLASSFLKRRMRLAATSRSFGLDHIPEALLPALVLAAISDVTTTDVVAITAIFILFATVISPLLHTFGIRKQPY